MTPGTKPAFMVARDELKVNLELLTLVREAARGSTNANHENDSLFKVEGSLLKEVNRSAAGYMSALEAAQKAGTLASGS